MFTNRCQADVYECENIFMNNNNGRFDEKETSTERSFTLQLDCKYYILNEWEDKFAVLTKNALVIKLSKTVDN